MKYPFPRKINPPSKEIVGIQKLYFNDNPFSGKSISSNGIALYSCGYLEGIALTRYNSLTRNIRCYSNGEYNGYLIEVQEGYITQFATYDMGMAVEILYYDKNIIEKEYSWKLPIEERKSKLEDILIASKVSQYFEKIKDEFNGYFNFEDSDFRTALLHEMYRVGERENIELKCWAYLRLKHMKEGYYEGDKDFLPYYYQQEQMRQQVIKEDQLPAPIRYIAGVDVAYNDLEQRMVGGIVVLDAQTLQVVDQAIHQMDVTFPYVPGLFSFREIPPLLEAYQKLSIKPDLIVCDAQGIAHPKNVGMATHLGIALNIPTIGCAKKRLVGHYEKEQLGKERGAIQPLIWNGEVVGVALRTQTGVNPMFVSIGHRISLETAIEWVMKLTPAYRLPETTRASDHLVNRVMKHRLEIDMLGDDQEDLLLGAIAQE